MHRAVDLLIDQVGPVAVQHGLETVPLYRQVRKHSVWAMHTAIAAYGEGVGGTLVMRLPDSGNALAEISYMTPGLGLEIRTSA